jgi:hypothetical protein
MKKQNLILLLFLSVLALGACDLISGASSNLVGTWDIFSVTQKTYTNGALDTTSIQNDLGSFTFNSGGDGTYSVINGEETQSGSFDWFEKNNKVFINMLNLTDSIMTKNLAIGFDVVSNTSTKQVWSMSYSYYQTQENPSTGIEVNYLMKMYMEIDLRKQ